MGCRHNTNTGLFFNNYVEHLLILFQHVSLRTKFGYFEFFKLYFKLIFWQEMTWKMKQIYDMWIFSFRKMVFFKISCRVGYHQRKALRCNHYNPSKVGFYNFEMREGLQEILEL